MSLERPHRMSRLMTPARWSEYREVLRAALASGYRVVALEDWVLNGPHDGLVLVLRHDVDQHPRAAVAMATIEAELGITSTWYLRWCTADHRIISYLRSIGASVGLHYETLSRMALERRVNVVSDIDSILDDARLQLREEVCGFQELHGPIRSVCAHGDTRVPFAQNIRVMANEDPRSYNIDFEAYEAMKGRGLAYWLTDRLRGQGCWVNHVRPTDLFSRQVSPILAVVHPHAWASGPSLLFDRLLSSVLPDTFERPYKVLSRTRGGTPRLSRSGPLQGGDHTAFPSAS